MSTTKELSLMEHSEKVKHSLGSRIRVLRRQQNLTQEALAEKAHINAAYLGAAERGQANPTIDILASIAYALDVDLSALFFHETTDKFQMDEQLELYTSEFIQKVKQLYQKD